MCHLAEAEMSFTVLCRREARFMSILCAEAEGCYRGFIEECGSGLRGCILSTSRRRMRDAEVFGPWAASHFCEMAREVALFLGGGDAFPRGFFPCHVV
jgi:hypothetical protein